MFAALNLGKFVEDGAESQTAPDLNSRIRNPDVRCSQSGSSIRTFVDIRNSLAMEHHLLTWVTPNKKWVSYFHRTAQPRALAPFPTWGIQQELVVKDLPTAKLTLYFLFPNNFAKFVWN
jgi:hypothetical protein